MDDDGAKSLMCAIVMQTVKDYKSALYRYNTKKDMTERRLAERDIWTCEQFLRRDSGAYCKLDGEQIIARTRRDVRKRLKKKKVIMEIPNGKI